MRETKEEVYVVKKLRRALLVKRVEPIQAGTSNWVQQFPEVFQGLGKLEGEYKIRLSENARPFIVTTPRRVAIRRVKDPTDWCAGMVVVPKSEERVRICVDLTKLNESMRRERHPLPPVEQTLAQLAEARVFSKLDANSGFWQIPLVEESTPLTTFITPFGQFFFNRLPFGITSGPEW